MLNDRLQISDKRNGYTLVEILVSLTIIGLLFAAGYSNFRDFSRRQELSGAAKSVQGDLRLAQENAISGQKPTSGVSCLDGFNFHVKTASTYSLEATCGAVSSSVKDVSLPAGITISPLPPILKFKILGQGTNLNAGANWTLVLTQAGTSNTLTITVTPGGQIQ